ncbi:MAG TPA: hypothetical protein VGX94_19670, partial [Terriglobia bacterium]|nr:hypothetical protein [Terriglobia bacterium]
GGLWPPVFTIKNRRPEAAATTPEPVLLPPKNRYEPETNRTGSCISFVLLQMLRFVVEDRSNSYVINLLYRFASGSKSGSCRFAPLTPICFQHLKKLGPKHSFFRTTVFLPSFVYLGHNAKLAPSCLQYVASFYLGRSCVA